jgi:hypothetical protein
MRSFDSVCLSFVETNSAQDDMKNHCLSFSKDSILVIRIILKIVVLFKIMIHRLHIVVFFEFFDEFEDGFLVGFR